MDSLTQITLGAAVGEVLLGKKLGNKAMLWGAIGGTIPDLDIIGNAFLSEMEALAFHRGISHSLFFAVLSPIFFGWLLQRWNRRSWRKNSVYLWIKTVIWSFLYVGIVLIIYALFSFFDSPGSFIIWPIGLATGYFVMSRYIRREFQFEEESVEIHFREGYLLFFWAIITHILLDIFTAYGTQVFQPFHDCRAAVSSISVVDPIYTFPFLGLLIWASFIRKERRTRRILSWSGIAVSSLYLLFTVWNQREVRSLFDQTLKSEGYIAKRTHVSPTIMNNILWNCLAEGDSTFWLGDYSLFDRESSVHKKGTIMKNHQILADYQGERQLDILQWFSDEYYAVFSDSTEGEGWIVDLRYGSFSQSTPSARDFVFLFRYRVDEQGHLHLSQNRGNQGEIRQALRNLWTRINGI